VAKNARPSRLTNLDSNHYLCGAAIATPGVKEEGVDGVGKVSIDNVCVIIWVTTLDEAVAVRVSRTKLEGCIEDFSAADTVLGSHCNR